MVTRPARFTQADLRRAMKAAQQAGYRAPRIVIRPNGEMEIVTGSAANDQPPPEEDFDL